MSRILCPNCKGAWWTQRIEVVLDDDADDKSRNQALKAGGAEARKKIEEGEPISSYRPRWSDERILFVCTTCGFPRAKS